MASWYDGAATRSPRLENKPVLIRATVIREQDDVLTVRLDDGFASAEVVVHKDKARAA